MQDLAARERGTTALLLAHLAELDTRDVLLREGYASLFAYCREALGYSEHAALNRIEAARAARRFPVILEMLAAGTVHLTAVRLLAPHLTPQNHIAVLSGARGKRTEEIRVMAAALASRPVPVSVSASVSASASASARAAAAAAAGPPVSPAAAQTAPARNQTGTPQTSAPGAADPARPGDVPPPVSTAVPVAPAPYRRSLAVAAGTLEKLHLAKEMLRHALPTGDEDQIVDRALTLLLDDLARKKFAATDRPRAPRGATAGSRYVPAEVKRAVWLRDLGRCAYTSASGHRCTERGFLEFHHVKPYEVGGEATAENIQLRCGRHNRYEAKVYFAREETCGAVREVSNSF